MTWPGSHHAKLSRPPALWQLTVGWVLCRGIPAIEHEQGARGVGDAKMLAVIRPTGPEPTGVDADYGTCLCGRVRVSMYTRALVLLPG